MMLEIFIYGLYGSIMFFIITLFTIRILENMEENPKVALMNFFNKNETPKYFRVLSISASVLSIGYAFNMIGNLFGIQASNYITVFVNFMIFIVMAYFFVGIYKITSPVSKED